MHTTPRTTPTTSPKHPVTEQLHTWIDRAERHPQGVLKDLLDNLEQSAAHLNTAPRGGESR